MSDEEFKVACPLYYCFIADLESIGEKVGLNVKTQINHPHDPVANGILNGDADYDIQDGLIDDLTKNHKFDSYYPKVKKILKEGINNE